MTKTKLTSILAKASAVAIIASSTSSFAMTDAEFAQLNAAYTSNLRPTIATQNAGYVPFFDGILNIIQTTQAYQEFDYEKVLDFFSELDLRNLDLNSLDLDDEDIDDIEDLIGSNNVNALAALLDLLDSNPEAQKQTKDLIGKLPPEVGKYLLAVQQARNEQMIDASRILADVVSTISASTNTATQAHASIISNQLDSSLAFSGVSSGSENIYNGGAWIKGFGQIADQKNTKNHTPYKQTSFGGVIGVDSLLTDEFTLGAALGYTKTKINMKLVDAEFDVQTWLLSLYGAYAFNENLYTKSSLTYAFSDVKSDLGLSTNPKSKSSVFLADVALGYKVALADNIILAPEAGVRASTFNDNKITIEGPLNTKTNIKGRSGNNFQGSLGARLSADLGSASVSFTPSIYAKVIQQLGGKYPKIETTFMGTKFTNKAEKPQKTMFAAGVDLSSSTGPIDVNLGYEANLATKYLSHTGSLKLRVNF